MFSVWVVLTFGKSQANLSFQVFIESSYSCRSAIDLLNTDLASTGGAAVNLPILPLLVHSSVLNTPDLHISVSVKIVVISDAAADTSSVAAVVVSAAVAQISQGYAHLFIFFCLTTQHTCSIFKTFKSLKLCILYQTKICIFISTPETCRINHNCGEMISSQHFNTDVILSACFFPKITNTFATNHNAHCQKKDVATCSICTGRRRHWFHHTNFPQN